jgi:hypothetical protein
VGGLVLPGMVKSTDPLTDGFFSEGFGGRALVKHPPTKGTLDYRYLITSKHSLIRYLACNAFPKGYIFYTTSWIPEGKDPVLVDAKLILKHECHLPKQKQYRRRKANIATVKYIRHENLCVLLATHGKGQFFQVEGEIKDAREVPFSYGGYSVSVNRESGKVSVRIHREAMKTLKSFVMEHGHKMPLDYWQSWIRNIPFLPFAGVRDGVFSLLKLLNKNRQSFKKAPLDWRDCVRKNIKGQTTILSESPPELLELLQWQSRKKP